MSRRLILRIAAWCVLAAAVYFFLYVHPRRTRHPAYPHILLVQFDLEVSADDPTTPDVALSSLRSDSVLVSRLRPVSEAPLENIQALLHVVALSSERSPDECISLPAHLHRSGYRTEAFLHDPTGIALATLASCFDAIELFLGEPTPAQSVFEQAIDRFRKREPDHQPLFLYVRLHAQAATREALHSVPARLAALSQERPQDVLAFLLTTPSTEAPHRNLSVLVLASGRTSTLADVLQPASIHDIPFTLVSLADLPPMPGRDRNPSPELRPSPSASNDRP